MSQHAGVWVIKRWNELYETAETRKLKRLLWLPVPNKHDGRGLRRLMRREDGLEIFGAWCIILQVASKMPQRGVLEDQDGPLEPQDIADKAGVSVLAITHALSVLSSVEIGWISCDSSGSSWNYTSEGKGREGKGIEQKGTEPPAAAGGAPPIKTKDLAALEQESQFPAFQALWVEKCQTIPSTSDWEAFQRRVWRPRSFHQHQELLARLGEAEGPLWGTPTSWVESKSWERRPNTRLPAAKNNSAARAAAVSASILEDF